MKTLGRILMILAVFAIVMGITYVVANAVSAGSSSTSANMPAFERGGQGGPRPEGARPQFSNGQRPGSSSGGRGQQGIGWIFGVVKNIGIIAIIVVLITMPKRFMQRKPVPVRAE